MGEFNQPRWLRVIALIPALALAAFGAVGLVLADLGIYTAALALALGAVAFVGLCVCAQPALLAPNAQARNAEAGDAGERGSSLTGPAPLAGVAMIVVAVATAIWNAANVSQHVQINRDGGLYLNAGKWIAAHGTLVVKPYVGPFASSSAVVESSNGTTLSGHHVELSLSHMLPAVLAEAQSIGGDHLMFLVAPILGGVALVAFYLVACRLLRNSLAALGAATCLAFIMPQISFSRDTTSEIPTQVLLFSALWLLCNRTTLLNRRSALCAGLLLGLVQAMHVDGLAFLLGVPVVFATAWVHSRRAERGALRSGIVWSVVGIAIGIAFGFFDLLTRDHNYFANVRTDVVELGAAAIVMVAAAALALAVVHRADLYAAVRRVREPAAYAVGALALLGGFGAWFLRPEIEHAHGKANPMVAYVQRLNHIPIDATRRYGELSVRWINWYLGPLTLSLGIVAAAVVAWTLVRGSARFPVQIASFVLGPPALLYTWHPTITPDHIWATRRFLPAVFPALILLTFAAICAIASFKTGPAAARRTLAVALAVAAVAYPLWTLRHVSQMTEQKGDYAVVEAACRMLGPKSAVVMLQEPLSVVAEVDTQTLRSFCNVPVALMTGKPNVPALRSLASAWRADGRRLFVVAEFPPTIHRLFPGVPLRTTRTAANRHLLEYTLLRRPGHYQTEILRFVAARVPIAGAAANG